MNKISLENLGTVNKNLVTIGNLKLWFSYETIVAFNLGGKLCCRVNDWGPTTGKLINEIEPDKKRRWKSKEFELELKETLKIFNLYDKEK